MTTLQELMLRGRELAGEIGAIERQYGVSTGGLITKSEDAEVYEAKMTEMESIFDQLDEAQELARKSSRFGEMRSRFEQTDSGTPVPPMPAPTGSQARQKSFGELFVETEVYQKGLKSGNWQSDAIKDYPSVMMDGVSVLDLREKANLIHTGKDSFGADYDQAFPSVQRQPGLLPLLYPERTFMDLFSRVGTTDEIIEYVVERTFTSGAAMIGEATALTGTSGTKPSSYFDFDVERSEVQDLAHWMGVTNKMLRQANLRQLIDDRLFLGLDLVVEEQIVSGDGTGNNLLGILEAGIQTHAQGSDTVFDAIHKALTKVRVVGRSRPNFVAMHPYDWEQYIRLVREDNTVGGSGQYLFGAPAGADVLRLWGMTVTLTESLDEGTALVGDSRQATIFDRMRTNVLVGTINDDFTRNIRRFLVEMALAFVVWRPSAFAVITGLSGSA